MAATIGIPDPTVRLRDGGYAIVLSQVWRRARQPGPALLNSSREKRRLTRYPRKIEFKDQLSAKRGGQNLKRDLREIMKPKS
jgi:hypothetical protein